MALIVNASDDNELSEKILLQGAKIEYQKKEVNGLHQIVLSSPKRINNELFIEKEIRQGGELTVVLSVLTPAVTLNDAYEFYKAFFKDNGEKKYQCEQRSCGVSSYWANNVFDERKLTGRDSDQYYLAGLVDFSGEKYWMTVYLVSNALRQNLIYLRYVKQSLTSAKWENGSLLSLNPEFSNSWIESLNREINSNDERNIYLAVYVNGAKMGSISDAKNRSDTAFIKIQKQLSDALVIDPDRIKMHFVGPFHTQVANADSDIWFRLYLFKS